MSYDRSCNCSEPSVKINSLIKHSGPHPLKPAKLNIVLWYIYILKLDLIIQGAVSFQSSPPTFKHITDFHSNRAGHKEGRRKRSADKENKKSQLLAKASIAVFFRDENVKAGFTKKHMCDLWLQTASSCIQLLPHALTRGQML